MKTLCIVSCGKNKIWNRCSNVGPTNAKDTYIGSFFKSVKSMQKDFIRSHGEFCL